MRRDDAADSPCEFTEELMSTAQEGLGRSVRVFGARSEGTRRRAVVLVTRMEILDDGSEADELNGE